MGDRAADRAPVADLLVGDQARRVGDDGRAFAAASSAWRVPAPIRSSPSSAPMPRSSSRPLMSTSKLGAAEAQLHQREQRVTAREQLRVLAALGERADRVVDRVGAVVVELGGDHEAPPSPGRAGPEPAAPWPCSPTSAPCSLAGGPEPSPRAASIASQTRIGVSGMSM